MELTPNTIISGVICRKCKATLADHNIKNHLDTKFMANFHKCKSKTDDKQAISITTNRQKQADCKH